MLSFIKSLDDLLPAARAASFEQEPVISSPGTAPYMRDKLVARATCTTHTCSTHKALLNILGLGVQVGEHRNRREREVITVPGEGQAATTSLLQLVGVLSCYNVPPPPDLQSPKSDISLQKRRHCTNRSLNTLLPGNSDCHGRRAESSLEVSSETACLCRRLASRQR